MKYAIVILSFLIVSACGTNQVSKQSPTTQSYGATISTANTKDITELPLLMADSDSVLLTLTGTIEKTCAVKGCWMQLQTGSDHNLRVTFLDYGFFVPKSGTEGKKATIQGYCLRQETSVEELRHYAKDAGESEDAIALITEPKMEYNFVASGVIIED